MNKYRKGLKGYSTSRKLEILEKSIDDLLADFNAEAVMKEYTYLEGERVVKAISFKVQFNGTAIGITLPLQWERTAEVLKQQRMFKNDLQSYRVSLYNLLEWLDAQLAMLTCQMVELPQIFLPYVQGKGGQTLYQSLKESNFKLGYTPEE